MDRNERGHFQSRTKVIDGQTLKLCKGPGHDEPTWLPMTEKYFYVGKTGRYVGKFYHRCRLCTNWEDLKSPGLSGMVPAVQVRQYFIEGVNRVGMTEFSRRAGLSPNAVNWIINGRTKSVQKKTVRKALLELISIRRKNEVRHRDSIHHGSLVRGRKEKEVKLKKDLYRPHGDSDAELRKQSRAA